MMNRKVSRFVVLFCLLFLSATGVVTAQSEQNCPRVMQRGNYLLTDPAVKYQWLDNKGNPIPDANDPAYAPPKNEASYAVEVSATSAPFRFDPNGNKPKFIKGFVTDIYLKPVAGARVHIQGKEVLTDEKGQFTISFLATDGRREILTCAKSDYFTGVRGFYPSAGDTLFNRFVLDQKYSPYTFEASNGGTFAQQDFNLNLPPNGFITSEGKRYGGKVNLYFRSALPGSAHFGSLMPGGDFLALNTSGERQALVSYGFTEVILEDEQGIPLQLAPMEEAQLSFAVPQPMQGNAPATMPLWFFSETEGLWREEGQAVLTNGRYIGTVKHFTAWNCDRPYPPATLTGKTVDCNNQPLPYGEIRIDEQMVTSDVAGNYEVRVGASLPYTAEGRNRRINGTAPEANQTLALPDLESVTGGKAIAFLDQADTLRIFTHNIAQPRHSIDGGTTYSENNTFNIAGLSPDNAIKVKVRSGDAKCTELELLKIYKLPRNGECYLWDINYLFLDSVNGEIRFPVLQSLHRPSRNIEDFNVTAMGASNSKEILQSAFLYPCSQFVNYNADYSEGVKPAPLPAFIFPKLNYLSVAQDYYLGDPGDERFYETRNLWSKPTLKHLNININNIVDTMYRDLFNANKRLVTLQLTSIAGNIRFNAKNIPQPVLEMNRLEVLTISQCKFETFPNFIFTHPSLKILKLVSTSTNQDTIKPGYVIDPAVHVNNSKMEGLYITEQVISDLSANFKQLTGLKYLQLRTCFLKSYPEALNDVPNLRILNLSTASDFYIKTPNSIKTIPPSIAKLSGTLKLLVLTGNPIPESERARIQSYLPNTVILW